MTAPSIITIDGAAGTGKSSVASLLAKKIGAGCLDSGAMYRAVAVLAKDFDIDPKDGPKLAAKVNDVGISFNWQNDPPTVMLGERDVSERIRELDISGIVSSVAKQPEVRAVLMGQQRIIASSHPLLVTEGRDQGSVVYPEAVVRFFLEADLEERTKRRTKQLQESGKDVHPDVVAEDIQNRDRIDTTRSDGPLICPEGAVVINTSAQSLKEVVETMEHIVNESLGQ